MIPSALALGPRVDVNLDALCANFRKLSELVRGKEIAGVVKCDAYGLGAKTVAGVLAAREGCGTFFVTYPEEGAFLRAALAEIAPDATIYVFNGPHPDNISLFTPNKLKPVLNSLSQAEFWKRAGRGPAAFHIDTGINRLGAPVTEAERVAAIGLHIDLVMSHLACSGEARDPTNEQQRLAFETAADFFPGVRRSLSASGGAFLTPAYHYDLIRAGAALYGVSPTDRPDARISPVATLSAPVLQIRSVSAGETAGYGRSWSFERPAVLATVALGYGDGLFRAASNRAHAFLGGILCPVVGRVSMDLTILDVTDAPEPIEIGSRAQFFGPDLPIEEAAAACGTIGYELLTGLGRRVGRRYLSNIGPA